MASCSNAPADSREEERPAAVQVPVGWKRLINKGKVVYVSPSEFRLHSLAEIACYVQTDGMCKCGLQCPLVLGRVFDFRSNVPTATRSQPPARSLCRHALSRKAEPKRRRPRGRFEGALVSQLLAQRDKSGRNKQIWDGTYDGKGLQPSDNGSTMYPKHVGSPMEQGKKPEAIYTDRVPPLPFGPTPQQFMHSPSVNFINLPTNINIDDKLNCNFTPTSGQVFGPSVNPHGQTPNPGAFIFPTDQSGQNINGSVPHMRQLVGNNMSDITLRQHSMQSNIPNYGNQSCGHGFFNSLQETQFPVPSSSSNDISPRFSLDNAILPRQKQPKKSGKVKINKINSVLDRGAPCPNIDVRQIPPEHHRPPPEAYALTNATSNYGNSNIPFPSDININRSFLPCVPAGRTNPQPFFDASKNQDLGGGLVAFPPYQSASKSLQDLSQMYSDNNRNSVKGVLGKLPQNHVACSSPQIANLSRLPTGENQMQDNFNPNKDNKNMFENIVKIPVSSESKSDIMPLYNNMSNSCPTSAIMSVSISSPAINVPNSMSISQNINVVPSNINMGHGNLNVPQNCINIAPGNINVVSSSMNVAPNSMNLLSNNMNIAQNNLSLTQNIPQSNMNIAQNNVNVIPNNMNHAQSGMNMVPTSMNVPSNNLNSQPFYNVSTQSNVINIPVSYSQNTLNPMGNVYSNQNMLSPQQSLMYSDASTNGNNGRQEFILQDVQQDGMLQVLSQKITSDMFSSRAQVVQQVSVLPGNPGGPVLLTPARAITMLPSPQMVQQQPPLLQSFIVTRPQEQKDPSFQKMEEENWLQKADLKGNNNEVNQVSLLGNVATSRSSSVPSNVPMMNNCGQVLINGDSSNSQQTNISRMIPIGQCALNSPMPPMSVPNVTAVTTTMTQMIPAIGIAPQILGQPVQPMVQVINTVPFNSMQNAVIVPGGSNMVRLDALQAAPFNGVVLPPNNMGCVPSPASSQASPFNGVVIPSNAMNCVQSPVTSQPPPANGMFIPSNTPVNCIPSPVTSQASPFNGVVLPQNQVNCVPSSVMPPTSMNCLQPNAMNCLQPNTMNCVQSNAVNCMQPNSLNCLPPNTLNCSQSSTLGCVPSPVMPSHCVQSPVTSMRHSGDETSSSCSTPASSSTPVSDSVTFRAMSPAVRKRSRDGKRKSHSQTVASMLQSSSSQQQSQLKSQMQQQQHQTEMQAQQFLQPQMQLQAVTVRPLLQQPVVNYGSPQILTGPLGIVQPLTVIQNIPVVPGSPFQQLTVLQGHQVNDGQSLVVNDQVSPMGVHPVPSAFGGQIVPSQQPPVAQSLSATTRSSVPTSSGNSRCSIGVQSEQTSPDSTRLKAEVGGECSREWWPDPINLSAAVRAVVQEQLDSNDCLPGAEEPDSASELRDLPTAREESSHGGAERSFREGDVVWGQVHGCPSWPGKLVAPLHQETGKLWVKWFGEAGGLSQVDADQLKTLSEGLEAHHRACKRHRRGRKMNMQLENAIQEAMMELDRNAPADAELQPRS